MPSSARVVSVADATPASCSIVNSLRTYAVRGLVPVNVSSVPRFACPQPSGAVPLDQLESSKTRSCHPDARAAVSKEYDHAPPAVITPVAAGPPRPSGAPRPPGATGPPGPPGSRPRPAARRPPAAEG